MQIQALFLPGQTELTVNGLTQWDYGRKLEIHSADLPALIEVHFACAGMTEAVVRSCAVVNGVAEAAIPDLCLEQTTPIVAWIYEVGESTGATVKTITLPIIARARPQAGETIPTPVSDKYTELIAAVNEQVTSLKKGSVTVNRALTADNATNATNATNASYATKAGNAALASRPSSGGSFITSGNNFGADKYTTYSGEAILGGVYMVIDPTYGNAVAIIDTKAEFSTVYYAQKPDGSGTHVPFRIKATTNADGFVTLHRQWYNGSSWAEISGSGLLHRAINTY